VKYQILFQ